MNIRKLKEYKKLNHYRAVEIADKIVKYVHVDEMEKYNYNHEETLAAWQYIIDNKLDIELGGQYQKWSDYFVKNKLIERKNDEK